MAVSNLPDNLINVDSTDQVKHFFDTYFVQPISYPAAENEGLTNLLAIQLLLCYYNRQN